METPISYSQKPQETLEALIGDLRDRQFKGEFECVSIFMSQLINRLVRLDEIWKNQKRSLMKQIHEKDAEMQSLKVVNKRLHKRLAFNK